MIHLFTNRAPERILSSYTSSWTSSWVVCFHKNFFVSQRSFRSLKAVLSTDQHYKSMQTSRNSMIYEFTLFRCFNINPSIIRFNSKETLACFIRSSTIFNRGGRWFKRIKVTNPSELGAKNISEFWNKIQIQQWKVTFPSHPRWAYIIKQLKQKDLGNQKLLYLQNFFLYSDDQISIPFEIHATNWIKSCCVWKRVNYTRNFQFER